MSSAETFIAITYITCFGISGIYTFISLIHMHIKRPIYAKTIIECDGPVEGKELLVEDCRQRQYLDEDRLPTGAAPQSIDSSKDIPVNGSSWKSIIKLYEAHNKSYIHFTPVYNMDEVLVKTTYLNSHAKVLQLLKKYKSNNIVPLQHKMNVPHTLQIPIQVRHTQVPGSKIYFDLYTGLISNNRNELLTGIMWKRRLPGTYTVMAIGCILTIGLHIS